MARIYPFRGIYYDPDRVTDLSLVATPPYDVITPEERRRYWQRHSNNIIRLILPEGEGGADKYEEAAGYLQRWQQQGILITEENSCIYPSQQYFTILSGETRKRNGFIALVKLEPLDGGVIIPHERTTPKPVEDRLLLLEACEAHLSQVFALYSDPAGEIERLFDRVWIETPRREFTDDDGVVHRLWCVDSGELINELSSRMNGKKLIIADGHHRYTTALLYRDKMRRMCPQASERCSFEYIMMYLTAMEDKGLVILPSHRLVPKRCARNPGEFLANVIRYFSMKPFNFEDFGGEQPAREAFFAALDEKAGRLQTFGLYIQGESRYLLLTFTSEVRPQELLNGYPEVVRKLDVALLDGVILKDFLQLRESDVGLTKDRTEALEEVRSGRSKMAFFLRPPTVEQVREVAEAGEVMPRKSTYFYPKVACGLVINKIDPSEEVTLM